MRRFVVHALLFGALSLLGTLARNGGGVDDSAGLGASAGVVADADLASADGSVVASARF